MPTPSHARATNLIQQTVAEQFRTRPTLRSVTAQMLSDNLKEKYPLLTHPISDLRLAQPRDGGGRALLPLLDIALEHLADGRYPDVSTRHGMDCYLSDATGTRLRYQAESPHDYDLQVIETVIHELPLILFIGFQDALAAYWGQDSDAGGSRWKWLSTVLQSQLRLSTLRNVDATSQQLSALSLLTRYPDRQTRTSQSEPGTFVYAYTPAACLQQGQTTLTLQAADLLVVSNTGTLLCTVSGEVLPFANVDAFGRTWAERMEARFGADRVTWQLYEPDGDIFEIQAALLLNQHLDDLAAVKLPGVTNVEHVQAQFASITDPSHLLSAETFAPQARLDAVLPTWLRDATPEDRFAYHQCLLEQTALKREALGDQDLNELDAIDTYAALHLNHQLCLERNTHLHGERTCSEEALAAGYNARELELTFHVPVGNLEGGYIERVTMSLLDLALKNLAGRPKGRMTVRHTGGREIEAWLTPDAILQLVQRVDIGRNYPNYLREHLLSDTIAAKKRQRLFCRQRPVQLSIQALEHKIRGEAGLTQRGFRCVRAAFKPSRSQRWVDNDEIVLRPLAFVRKPGATADVVDNMFIIEPKHTGTGPHLLYRPAYSQSLQEFPDRDALLAAIVQPGELQDSVLTWLSDSARPIYSNGGFTEPHYVRIGLGSEFDLPRKPDPATLASGNDESANEIHQAQDAGTLMEYLFNCQAHQLLNQAERESTSNSESRWALIVEGLQLGLNTLLMAVRGPMAAVGWLLQLLVGLKHDLPALESRDPTARELAWVDLLMNISMLLLHPRVPGDEPVHPRPDETRVEPAPARRGLERPQSTLGLPSKAGIQRGAIGLPAEPPGDGRTVLDFDRSLASDTACAALLEKLLAYNVRWPDPAPVPTQAGVYKGLYLINGQWHASVGGLLFRVTIVPGVGEVYIIHSEKPARPGILIKTDGKGGWTLDRGLKLAGGGPKRLAALRAKNLERKRELLAAIDSLAVEVREQLEPPCKQSAAQLNTWYKTLTEQRRKLRSVWRLLQSATADRLPALEARHQMEMRDYARVRGYYRTLLDTFTEQSAHLLAARQKAFSLGQELKDVAGAGAHVQDLEKMLENTWEGTFALYEYERGWLNDLFTSKSGEPLYDLLKRTHLNTLWGDRTAFDEHVANSIEAADTWQRMANATSTLETLSEQLERLSTGGRAIRNRLMNAIITPQYYFVANLKLNALRPLAWASFDLSIEPMRPQEALYYELLTERDLNQTLLSHIDVRSSNDYSLSDQRSVYETLIETYRRYENALRALNVLRSKRLLGSSARLLKGLQYACALAEGELETVVRLQEKLEVELPLSKTLRPKAPTKRVFKTRRKAYLIGDLQPANEHIAHEHLTISEPITGHTLATYDRQDNEWVETTRSVRVEPEPDVTVRTLAQVRESGRELISQRKGIEQQVAAEQLLVDEEATREEVDPDTWDTLLTTHARKLTALADELVRDHKDKPATQDLVDEYRAHARDLTRIAQRACSRAYKKQLPTADSVTYLWEHGEIDINLTSPSDPDRPTLSGDFFTEYAVYDKTAKPPVVLWYAHFHYRTADAPPASYTRAHLKLPEQRKFTQKDLLKAHVQAYLANQKTPGSAPVRKIVYVLITPPLDNLFLKIAPLPSATQ
ncbi:dermonecrotic toxin domain-containing protein [Pseudomonas azotoformans]|uniref:dermonecrotic toxin domain-containing protein n=1 Tax=Pseudomonas azotoformans TaxID=47878 RepID=UPI00098F9990|nr:DUF6543 domain-containing protein [Pseudomonas azotoformans]AQT94721.1 hypothetical protein B1R45_16095 [Pseudomonas azotoformans]UMY46831.1 hypothetical protein MLC69_16045 [Pseudomonas azotoformans]